MLPFCAQSALQPWAWEERRQNQTTLDAGKAVLGFCESALGLPCPGSRHTRPSTVWQQGPGDEGCPPCYVPGAGFVPPWPGWPPTPLPTVALSSTLWGKWFDMDIQEGQEEHQRRSFFRAVVLNSFWMEC